MIADERYKELLAHAKRTYHYMTERERERIMIEDYGKTPVELSDVEVMRRCAAMQADRKNGPQTPEEETLHVHMLREINEERIDRLDWYIANRNKVGAKGTSTKAATRIEEIRTFYKDLTQNTGSPRRWYVAQTVDYFHKKYPQSRGYGKRTIEKATIGL